RRVLFRSPRGSRVAVSIELTFKAAGGPWEARIFCQSRARDAMGWAGSTSKRRRKWWGEVHGTGEAKAMRVRGGMGMMGSMAANKMAVWKGRPDDIGRGRRTLKVSGLLSRHIP